MLKIGSIFSKIQIVFATAVGLSAAVGAEEARAQWGGWESLGGVILEQADCVSWGSNRIDCFARGTDRAMWHRWWNGSSWGGWESLGGIILEQPDCVSWGSNRIDCFARGTDRAMWHRWWNGSSWGGWESLGGIILEQPDCVSWGSNRIDCFARGTDRAMWHRWWNGSSWGGWESLGGIILEQPDCVSWGSNRIDCFARGTDRAMWHRWWNGSSWGGWESLGGITLEEASCTTWSANRIDCFARGTDRAMWHRWWNGSSWGGWETLGGIILEQPACVSWGANRIDCFGRGLDNALWHRWWPCPGCGISVHNLQVSRFNTATITNADADRIFADASTVLQTNNGAGDLACTAGFTRNGNVTTFATGDGSIDSQAEFNAVVGTAGWVKVVNQINWCSGLAPNIIGCAPVPGSSLAIVRITPGLEGILLAHEFGHNKGRGHRNDDANAVMNGTIGATHLRVNNDECTAYRNLVGGAVAFTEVMPGGDGSPSAQESSMVTPGTMPAGEGMASGDSGTMPLGDGGGVAGSTTMPGDNSMTMPQGEEMPGPAVSGAMPGDGGEIMPQGESTTMPDGTIDTMPGGGGTGAAATQDVGAFVRQVFIHGVPYEDAVQFDSSNVPKLVAMLADPEEKPYWANIVVVLGMIGGEQAIDPLIAFIEEGSSEMSREVYAAKTSAIMSLGYVLNKTGSQRVMDYLVKGLDPVTWTARNSLSMAPFQSNLDERNVDFGKYAILALALSGRPEAATALQALQQERPTAPEETREFQVQVSDLVSDAIAENRKIAEKGLLRYYEAQPE